MILQHIEARSQELQASGVDETVAIDKAIEEAEEKRKVLGKKGQKASLYRLWKHLNNYK